MAHDTLTLCIGKEFALISEEASCRDKELYTHTASLGVHIKHFSLTGTDLLHNGTYAVLRNIDNKALHRLKLLAGLLVGLEEHTRSRNSQLIAFTAHILDEDREVHLTSSGNTEGICAVCFSYTERNVTEELTEESLTELTGSHELALLAGKRAVVNGESHLNGRLTYLYEGQRVRGFCSADSITDSDALDTGYPDNIAHFSLLNGNTVQALYLKEGDYLGIVVLFGACVVTDSYLLIYLDIASYDTADADTADVLIVVDRGNEHLERLFLLTLRRLDVVDDSIEKGLEIGACLILAERSSTASS